MWGKCEYAYIIETITSLLKIYTNAVWTYAQQESWWARNKHGSRIGLSTSLRHGEKT